MKHLGAIVALFLLLSALPTQGQESPLAHPQASQSQAQAPQTRSAGTGLPSVRLLAPAALGISALKPSLLANSGLGGTPQLQPSYADPAQPLEKSPGIPDKALRIEALAFLPASGTYSAMSASEIQTTTAALLCQVENLEGLYYWSASRKRMRLLYETVYKVDSPQSSNPVLKPDAQDAEALKIGDTLEFFAYQKDQLFGGAVFAYSIGRGEHSVIMKSENSTAMRYLLLPFVAPGGMKSRLTVLPCAEGFLLYFVSTIESVNMATQRVLESAGNRALALLGWLAGQSSRAGLTLEQSLPVNIMELNQH